MPLKFNAVIDPPAETVQAFSDLAPENPFYTVEYLEVRRRLGAEPSAITLDSEQGPVTGCLGFLTRGKLNSRIEITSLPLLPDQGLFWNGLFGFCRSQGISVLNADSFASTEATITEQRHRVSHKRRSEYRLDLRQPDLWALTNRRTHRLIKKARSFGLTVQRSSDADARAIHVALANASLERLRGKGESIESAIKLDEVNAFLECGAGELFQAVGGDEVHSSILVARSRTGGYSQSSGTSEPGRGIGSSHFLFHEIACLLKSEGVELFNFGGADEHSKGLQEFKLGLGAEKIELESAEFFTGSPLKKLATGAINVLKGVSPV